MVIGILIIITLVINYTKGNMNFSNYDYDSLDYSHDTNVQFGAIDPFFPLLTNNLTMN